jgi:hypothetical protein
MSRGTIAAWNAAASRADYQAAIHPIASEGTKAYRMSGLRDAEATLRACDGRLDLDGATVIDYGCGDGRVAAAVSFLEPAARLIGYDPAPAMLDRLVVRMPEGRIRPESRWERVPPADLIYSWCVFIHLTSAERVGTLAMMSAKLNPGGLIVAQAPIYRDTTEPGSWTGVGVTSGADWSRWVAGAGLREVETWGHLDPFSHDNIGGLHNRPQVLGRDEGE